MGASVTLSMMMSTSCGHCCSCLSRGSVARLARKCAQSRSRLRERSGGAGMGRERRGRGEVRAVKTCVGFEWLQWVPALPGRSDCHYPASDPTLPPTTPLSSTHLKPSVRWATSSARR